MWHSLSSTNDRLVVCNLCANWNAKVRRWNKARRAEGLQYGKSPAWFIRIGRVESGEWRGISVPRTRVNQQLSEEAVGKEKMSIITHVEKFSALVFLVRQQPMPSPQFYAR